MDRKNKSIIFWGISFLLLIIGVLATVPSAKQTFAAEPVVKPPKCEPSMQSETDYYGASWEGTKTPSYYGPLEYLACWVAPPGTGYEREVADSEISLLQNTRELIYWTKPILQKYTTTEWDANNCGGKSSTYNGTGTIGYSSVFTDGQYRYNILSAPANVVGGGSKKSGILSYTGSGSMNGKNCGSSTTHTYYVKEVKIVPSKDTLEDELKPTYECIEIFGDNTTRKCNPTIQEERTATYIEFTYSFHNSLSDNGGAHKNRQWFFKNVHLINGVPTVHMDAVRGASSNPAVVCQRIYYNDETRDCTVPMLKNPNKNGWSTGGGTRQAYFMYDYQGPISYYYDKKETTRNYYYVTSVEFPTETNTKDAYVSTNAIYNDSAPAPALVEEGYNVQCIKTFGDGKKVDCIDNIKYAVNSNGIADVGYPSGSFPTRSVFVHNTNQNGWVLGGGIRHNYYSFEENAHKKDWTVNMLYVVKVLMENGTPQNQFVAVNETNEKYPYLGTPTKSTDPQETDPYTPPTCQKTFATASTGVAQVRNCFSQMEWHHNFNGWGPGGSERILRFKYKENLKEDEWKIHFTYVQNVNITLDSLVYQDEDYGTYTCVKTYHHSFIGGGNTKSCLDRMFIVSDSGQNKNLGGERKIRFDYQNNTHTDNTLQTRPYAYETIVTSDNNTSGTSGTKENYTCDVRWQNDVRKDITGEPLVWKSTVGSPTGQEVNFIGEEWADGFIDLKGQQHKPDAVSQFYVPDPMSNEYFVHCTYPLLPNPGYDNGLRPGWSFLEDGFAPEEVNTEFDVIGIKEIQIIEDTQKIHEVDINTDGETLKNQYEVTAAPFTGKGNPPEEMVFNDKTYQTGHWYDFKIKIIWTDGTEEIVEDNIKYPELSYRYDANGWKQDGSGYKVEGNNTNFPDNPHDHRLPNEGWNSIRVDLFSENSIPKPTGQNNSKKSVTYEEASMWAHSPIELIIEGATKTDWGKEEQYDAYLLWNDWEQTNQSGESIGESINPWNESLPKGTKITGAPQLSWASSEQGTLVSKNPMVVTFNEYAGNGNYRTLSAIWGDKVNADALHGIPGGFQYWDYFTQEIEVQVGDDKNAIDPSGPTMEGCKNINVPKFGCALPIDSEIESNYRLPSSVEYTDAREIRHAIEFTVFGVSKGTGQ